jgi:UDP-N-acetylglucosamine 2-epimerase
MLVLGDTNSCMAVLPAKRRKIPTFHMEAGNRCFDQRVPEEINRRLVDHMADINLPYSNIAREYLLSEGLPADMIIKTGSPMFEVINTYKNEIDSSEILTKLNLKKHKFFVVSVHREENIDSDINFLKLIESLNLIAENYNMPIIVSTHPRTQKRIDSLGTKFHSLIQLLKPVGFKDYNKLQISAKAVLSDSGTINEESSIMNFPALNLRETHERPEGMEEAVAIMTGLGSERILQSLLILETQPRGSERLIRQVYDYSMPNVSEKIVRIIHSYTDYVNRVVWKKY